MLSVTIHDCEVQTFRAGGKGGQNQNKRDTGVRVIHHPSGARAESREERSQLQNKKTAFVRMTQSDKFRRWLMREVFEDELTHPDIYTDKEIPEEEIKVEFLIDGRWVEE